MTLPVRVMALAAKHGRVGMVLMINGRLKDWETSQRAATSPAAATAVTTAWIIRLDPQVVVTEQDSPTNRKSAKTKALVAAMTDTAQQHKRLSISLARRRVYKNKYLEAEALATRYPDIAPWLPKSRVFYMPEHPSTVLLDALALAHAVQENGAITLARAMG